jgi:hypothetical protein
MFDENSKDSFAVQSHTNNRVLQRSRKGILFYQSYQGIFRQFLYISLKKKNATTLDLER